MPGFRWLEGRGRGHRLARLSLCTQLKGVGYESGFPGPGDCLARSTARCIRRPAWRHRRGRQLRHLRTHAGCDGGERRQVLARPDRACRGGDPGACGEAGPAPGSGLRRPLGPALLGKDQRPRARDGTDFIGRPPGWGRRQIENWELTRYRRPGDRLEDSWDFAGKVSKDAQLGMLSGWLIAQAETPAHLVIQGEFEAARKRALAAVR